MGAPAKLTVNNDPPLFIIAAARLAASVKEKHEITSVRIKFSRLVSA